MGADRASLGQKGRAVFAFAPCAISAQQFEAFSLQTLIARPSHKLLLAWLCLAQATHVAVS